MNPHIVARVTVPTHEFRSAFLGRETLAPRMSIPRHRHRHGYITVVLSGCYEEAGLTGRFELREGDVVVHRSFDAHLDRVRAGAELLNLPLPATSNLPTIFKIEDPDSIVRMAEHDPRSSALALSPTGVVPAAVDWPDELALAIIQRPALPLGPWADANGLAVETLSRGFRKAFGVTPARFRVETQVHRALQLIEHEDKPLAEIAAECGFSDQSHLTRSTVRLTGRSPGYWRHRSITFKTGDASPP